MADKIKVFKPNGYGKKRIEERKYINASISEPDWWQLKSMASKKMMSVQDYDGMILRHHLTKYEW